MLWITALGIGLLHTLLGPDHYLPFIVIGRARRWGLGRTSLLTFVCGLGHIGSSVVIGLVGVALGAALGRVQGWEATRGNWAGWALLLFGAVYCLWGLWRAFRKPHHRHVHLHDDGVIHAHPHTHGPAIGHPSVHGHDHGSSGGGGSALRPEHAEPASWKSLTPWVLFVIFVLGPCEPLIPLFFASALAHDWMTVALVCAGYGLATLAAMHALVTLCWFGLRKVRLGGLERWSHAAAGAVLLLAGIGMVFLGL